MKMKHTVKNHHKKRSTGLTLSGLASFTLALVLHSNLIYAGSMKGSAHDLVSQGFNAGENCIICHTPHNSDISITITPLWNHEPHSSTYDMYMTNDDTIEAQPTGASKLCLSCHDGVTAIDKLGGRATIPFMNGDSGANVKNLQTDSHPVSIMFNSAMAEKNPSLYDPAIKRVTIGAGSEHTRTGTIAEVLLADGRVQCTSCHDVHNNLVGANQKDQPFLKVTRAGSEICLTCHKK